MTFGKADFLNPQQTFELYEDFCGAIDNTALTRYKDWICAVNVGTVLGIAPFGDGTHGLVQLAGGALAGQFASIATAPIMNGVPAGNSQYLFYHYQVQAGAATWDQRLGFGLTPGAAGELASGIFFRAVGAGNWFAVCRNGGVETVVDTGIAQTAQVWKKFLIDISGPAGAVAVQTVRFNIDGVLVAEITTDLPAAGVLMNLFAKCDTTGAAAAEAFALDYVWARINGLVR